MALYYPLITSSSSSSSSSSSPHFPMLQSFNRNRQIAGVTMEAVSGALTRAGQWQRALNEPERLGIRPSMRDLDPSINTAVAAKPPLVADYKLKGIILPGWWFGTFFIFPNIGDHHPNWLIFFRGVAQPPTSLFEGRIWLDWSMLASPRTPPAPTTLGSMPMACLAGSLMMGTTHGISPWWLYGAFINKHVALMVV